MQSAKSLLSEFVRLLEEVCSPLCLVFLSSEQQYHLLFGSLLACYVQCALNPRAKPTGVPLYQARNFFEPKFEPSSKTLSLS